MKGVIDDLPSDSFSNPTGQLNDFSKYMHSMNRTSGRALHGSPWDSTGGNNYNSNNNKNYYSNNNNNMNATNNPNYRSPFRTASDGRRKYSGGPGGIGGSGFGGSRESMALNIENNPPPNGVPIIPFYQVYVELQQLRKVPPDCEIINFFNQKSVFNPTQALTPFLQKTPQVDQNFVLRWSKSRNSNRSSGALTPFDSVASNISLRANGPPQIERRVMPPLPKEEYPKYAKEVSPWKYYWDLRARWIKLEQTMENSRAWSKPRISSLSFQSIIKCRKLCDEAIMILDVEETKMLDLSGLIADRLEEANVLCGTQLKFRNQFLQLLKRVEKRYTTLRVNHVRYNKTQLSTKNFIRKTDLAHTLSKFFSVSDLATLKLSVKLLRIDFDENVVRNDDVVQTIASDSCIATTEKDFATLDCVNFANISNICTVAPVLPAP
ncbi:uncharacterized protein LOC142354222 [Convolutriloba macropyga]|uniref:uncharacterized protein LOC142354222 n=1 Tax=Convolutriloba macropyga TaxID=536237 RepID=UPI003F51C6FD